MVPDREGKMRDVVLGFSNIDDYINIPSDFGAAIGRYANRIANGRFTIDEQTTELPQNNNGHTLHGGPGGWHTKVFGANQTSPASLELTLVSPDGDQSFPGNVTAKVTYTLTDDNAIDIKYSAVTDRPTVINMTNHSYFNLSGDPATLATGQILYVNADGFTPADATLIPTGEIAPVAGTPMDFTAPKLIGRDIDATDFEQIKLGGGYDHNYVLNTAGDISQPAARLESPASGIAMEVYTNEPGIQVYSGNFLDGTVTGKGGVAYKRRAAVCLETQHYPDSPNRPDWPSVVLRPGETYHSECVYKFYVEK
jgi:aldose 1-epimerase